MENVKFEDLPARPEADQAAFFQACDEFAEEALIKSERVTVTLRVAGGLMQIDFAGPALAELMLGALAHLFVETDEAPDIRLKVYDTRSTGVGFPEMPVRRNCLTDRGDIWSFNSKRYLSAFHWLESSVSVMDVSTGDAVFYINQADDLPYWTKASPFRTIFHWWMMQRGAQLIHAAGIGYEDGAVLITGKGGVGKSTTSLAAIEHGMSYVADDYLVVSLDDGPKVHSLYNTAKLNPDQVARFPDLAGLIRTSFEADEKAVISLYPDRKDQILSSLPIKAVLSPSFGESAETSFEGISAADLF
ncbi:MAG: ArsA-related P-loop ATPase, partial [Pseudomonadota bacterium]